MKIIPTFTLKGNSLTPEEQLDSIMTYYQSMPKSTTLRYKGQVRSLQYAIYHAGTGPDNMEVLVRRVKEDLTLIVSNNFPEYAEVEVTQQLIDENESRINLLVSITVKHDGKTYDLATSLDSINSRYKDVHEVETKL